MTLTLEEEGNIMRLTRASGWVKPVFFGAPFSALPPAAALAFAPLPPLVNAVLLLLFLIGAALLVLGIGAHRRPAFLELDQAGRRFRGRLTQGSDQFLVDGLLSEISGAFVREEHPASSTLPSLEALTIKGGVLNVLVDQTSRIISGGTVRTDAEDAEPQAYLELSISDSASLAFADLCAPKRELEHAVSSITRILAETR